MRFLLAAVLCACALSAQTKPPSAFDKPTLEAYLRHVLALPAEVEFKIDDPKPSPLPGTKEVNVHLSLGQQSQDETVYISNDGKQIVRGIVYDIGKNPFAADLAKLKTANTPSYGPDNAPVTIIVFADFECPQCKEEAKTMRENIPTKFPTQVRVFFKDFPLDAIHPWARPAAIAGRCIFHQTPAAFWKYHDKIYDLQAEITKENLKDKVLEWAKTADIDTLQLGRCMDTKATEPEVDQEVAEAKALHIDATPTSFVDGRRLVGNYPWTNLEQVVNLEVNYQKTHPAATAESCCEISIPSPIKK